MSLKKANLILKKSIAFFASSYEEGDSYEDGDTLFDQEK
jgi:hypothetical protein